MTERLLQVLCGMLLGMVFVEAGCQQKLKKELIPATGDAEVAVEPNETAVVPEYVNEALNATGTLESWVKAQNIDRDCVVTFYKPDGSFYLTEQHHEIYPWSDSVRISSREPEGKLSWQLLGEKFEIEAGAEIAAKLPVGVCNHSLARAILDITTAPVRLLINKDAFGKDSNPVRVEGLWYYPIARVAAGREKTAAASSWSQKVFYQKADNYLIDMLWFAPDAGGALGIAVRGYDYRCLKDSGVWVPGKIEIFKTRANHALLGRLVEIDYK